MALSGSRASLGGTLYLSAVVLLGAYFVFAAIQGESGVLAQRRVAAEVATLAAEKTELEAQLASLQNLTRRLSDDYLDLDLLDERARAVLGYARADEIILR